MVGRTGVKTFIVRGRSGSQRIKAKIARVGDIGEDGQPWTVKAARARARTLLGTMAAGNNPNVQVITPSGEPASGPTLRDAMNAHLTRMRKKGRAARSLEARSPTR